MKAKKRAIFLRISRRRRRKSFFLVFGRPHTYNSNSNSNLKLKRAKLKGHPSIHPFIYILWSYCKSIKQPASTLAYDDDGNVFLLFFYFWIVVGVERSMTSFIMENFFLFCFSSLFPMVNVIIIVEIIN